MKKYFLNELDDDIRNEVNKYDEIFRNVNEYVNIEIFLPNEHIIDAYKPIKKLYFLFKGKAKVSLVHENGKRSIVHFIKPKEFIGELTLLDIEKSHKDVIAISECFCISIPIEETKKRLIQDDKFLLILSRYIGTKLIERTWFASKHQNYELRNRLAAYILMTEYNDVYREKHTETAEYLGVSYRHLLYTLRIFQDENLLIKENKGFRINREKLVELAKILE